MPRSTPFAAALLLAVLSVPLGAAEPAVLKSPTGKVEVSFSLAEDGAPVYSVTYAGKPVVAGSRLGLTLRQTGPLASGFRVLDVKRASRDEKYTLVAGKTRDARDRSEEMTVSLERPGEKPVRLDVVFRAFDDGAAFRYVLPQQPGLDRVEVVSEDTRFRFLADHKAWVLLLASFTTSNEREFVPMPLLGIKPESIVGPPLTIEAGDGLVVALAEANLRKWSGLHFARVEGGNDSRQPTLVTKLAPLPSQPDVVVRGALPLVSPWRVLMLGTKPGDLVASTILTSLADPNEIGDTSWIKPGQGGLGLVERARDPERPVQSRHEQRDVPVLHRLRRRVRSRVRADRCRLVRRPPGRRGRHHPGGPGDGRSRPRRVREGEERRAPRLAQLGGGARADGRGVPALREVGPGRRQDRLHGPQGPGDRRLLPARHAHRGEVPSHRRLPRRLRGLGRGADLPELADPRGRDGPRVLQVERPGHPAAQRHDPLHPDARRARWTTRRAGSAT